MVYAYDSVVGEETQLLKGSHDPLLVRVAFDVGDKFRREELASHHTAFQLRHVHAVGRKSSECLVERGWAVPHPKNKGGDDGADTNRGPKVL